jgi:hypothetical protein
MRPVDIVTGLLIALLVSGTPVYAEPPSNADQNNSSDISPSLELLEYLGEFETDDGEWIDPEELEQMEDIDDKQENQNTREDYRD